MVNFREFRISGDGGSPSLYPSLYPYSSLPIPFSVPLLFPSHSLLCSLTLPFPFPSLFPYSSLPIPFSVPLLFPSHSLLCSLTLPFPFPSLFPYSSLPIPFSVPLLCSLTLPFPFPSLFPQLQYGKIGVARKMAVSGNFEMIGITRRVRFEIFRNDPEPALLHYLRHLQQYCSHPVVNA